MRNSVTTIMKTEFNSWINFSESIWNCVFIKLEHSDRIFLPSTIYYPAMSMLVKQLQCACPTDGWRIVYLYSEVSQGLLQQGVCKWSPEGLCDKSVSWIPNTDEFLKLLKKKKIIGLHFVHTQARSCRTPWVSPLSRSKALGELSRLIKVKEEELFSSQHLWL